MKIIFGLGNPGKEYKNTRHNVGFGLLDYIASKNNLEFKREMFNGSYVEMIVNNEKVLLVKPLKYMNLSGEVVISYVNYYKVSKSDILIIHDDIDMILGKIKIVCDSSSGGHNGVSNIISLIGSQEFNRLKIGVSKNKQVDIKDYVLGNFSLEEVETIANTYEKLVSIINDFVNLSINDLMTKYNNK